MYIYKYNVLLQLHIEMNAGENISTWMQQRMDVSVVLPHSTVMEMNEGNY